MKTGTCPKCGYTASQAFADCPRCGVIVRKFLQIRKRGQGQADTGASGKHSALENLARANVLIVRQEKEWGEIVTGFETRNRYNILDHWGNQMFQAEEVQGAFGTVLARLLLTALRPFTMNIYSADGLGILTLKRPFRFYFHELQIYGSNGAELGVIKKRFSVLRRIYTVLDKNGREVFQLFGPLLHPWTFQIKKGGQELGKITKKWSGLMKESFTDADNFGIRFPKGIDGIKKAVLLGAVFLIDFVHFENRGGNRSSASIRIH